MGPPPPSYPLLPHSKDLQSQGRQRVLKREERRTCQKRSELLVLRSPNLLHSFNTQLHFKIYTRRDEHELCTRLYYCIPRTHLFTYYSQIMLLNFLITPWGPHFLLILMFTFFGYWYLKTDFLNFPYNRAFLLLLKALSFLQRNEYSMHSLSTFLMLSRPGVLLNWPSIQGYKTHPDLHQLSRPLPIHPAERSYATLPNDPLK